MLSVFLLSRMLYNGILSSSFVDGVLSIGFADGRCIRIIIGERQAGQQAGTATSAGSRQVIVLLVVKTAKQLQQNVTLITIIKAAVRIPWT